MTLSAGASATIVGLCWVATSAILSTRGNSNFVATFHDAMAHNCVRFTFSSICGHIFLRTRHGAVRWSSFRRKTKVLLWPSVLLWLANFANSVSLERTGISVTYVFKSLIPFLTVLVCRFMGQQFSLRIYACLVPICIGVCLATLTDLQLDAIGALFAFSSALAQTGLNIKSKSSIRQLKVSGMEAFVVMSTTCVAISVPATMLWSLLGHGIVARVEQVGVQYAAAVVAQAGVTYFMEYSLNFAFVSCCTPLAFSITDICRRVATVLYGALLFNKPLTIVNAGGILLSLSGALAYSYISLQSAAQGLGPNNKMMSPVASRTPRMTPAQSRSNPKIVVKTASEQTPEQVKPERPDLKIEAVKIKDGWVSQYASLHTKLRDEDSADLEADKASESSDKGSENSSVDSPGSFIATMPIDRQALVGTKQWLDFSYFPAEATCVTPTGLCSWSVSPFIRQRTAPASAARFNKSRSEVISEQGVQEEAQQPFARSASK
eukprot:CAMPEP_0178424660 /NCGR_PEP_ID=MMETSP0689_2-20121128/28324_1 /TAXON_ID=160604 /ORGANISM="Amphidinium massartii, Strain CS-259" /LENGTH=491 /DNA_ID=CAMNT_0020046303 /DNA_START=6 /DNA_END=1481 /DNA_ORIENTATION=-